MNPFFSVLHLIFLILSSYRWSIHVSKYILKSTKELKELLQRYNELGFGSMMWDEVTDLTSPIWYEGILQSHSHVQAKNRYLNCMYDYYIVNLT